MTPSLFVLKDAEALAQEACKRFIDLASASIITTGQFTVVLAGGSTPKQLHKLLAQNHKKSLDWSKVFIFFGDERLVPPYHPDSNYGVADEDLIAELPIPDENVFPFVTIDISPEDAASLYEQELKRFFNKDVSFDLVILGMGPDGHTASLFPNHPALADDSGTLVLGIHDSPKPPPQRLTLSFKALNSAKTVMLLAAGESKSDALKRARAGEDLPIAKLSAATELVWLLDEAAASKLER